VSTPRKRARKLTDEEAAAIRAEPAHPGGDRAIAHAYGVAIATVVRLRSDLPKPKRAPWQSHTNAKLTLEQVEHIRSLPYRRGMVKALAEKFGVSTSIVSRVRCGRGYVSAEPKSERLAAAARAAEEAHKGGANWAEIARIVVEVYASKAWSQK